jgi:hypothetical protein
MSRGTAAFNSLEPPASANNVSSMQFYQLAKGARFELQGRQFQKVAMSLAEDEDRNGNAFWSGTEVTPIGEPLLLPETEADKGKLDECSPWTRLWTLATMILAFSTLC